MCVIDVATALFMANKIQLDIYSEYVRNYLMVIVIVIIIAYLNDHVVHMSLSA
jgi:hypothetical protein